MAVPTKTRELAYKVYRECGQNISETVRVMNSKHGYAVSRQSVTEWSKKYDWEARAARAEAEEKEQAEATSDEALLTVLLTQKKKYETYFESLAVGSVDNQAIYAYNSILKTLLDIREKISDHAQGVVDIDRPKLFLEDMEFIAETLKEIDPEGLKVFARNFDELITRFKEQHA